MDRAAAFEAEGRGFESLQARHLSGQLSAVSYQSSFPNYERSKKAVGSKQKAANGEQVLLILTSDS